MISRHDAQLHNTMCSKEAKAASEEEVLRGEEYSSNVLSQLLRASWFSLWPQQGNTILDYMTL